MPITRRQFVEENRMANESETQAPQASQAPDPQAATPPVAQQLILVHHTPAITKFCGFYEGRLPQDVESFIRSINFYLHTKNITDPQSQLAEAKGYLDLTRGDLADYLKSDSFRCCTTWTDLQLLLRKIYSIESLDDPVAAMRKLLSFANRDCKDNYAQHCAKCYDQINSFMPILKQSGWVTNDSISLNYLEKFLYLSLGLRAFPDAIISNISRKWQPSDSIVEINTQFNKVKSRVPNLDLTLLVQSQHIPQKETDTAVAGVREFSDKPKRNIQKRNQNQGQSNHKGSIKKRFDGQNETDYNKQVRASTSSPFKCFKCSQSGHIARNCSNEPYCLFHNLSGHTTNDCRARKTNRGNNYSNNQRGQRRRNNNVSESNQARNPSNQQPMQQVYVPQNQQYLQPDPRQTPTYNAWPNSGNTVNRPNYAPSAPTLESNENFRADSPFVRMT